MPNCKFYFLQRLKGSTSGDACDFNSTETRAVITFFFCLQGKAPKEIHAILTETLGEHAPLYAVKNLVAQFKCGDFLTCDAPCPGRPKTKYCLYNNSCVHKNCLHHSHEKLCSVALIHFAIYKHAFEWQQYESFHICQYTSMHFCGNNTHPYTHTAYFISSLSNPMQQTLCQPHIFHPVKEMSAFLEHEGPSQ